jgi:cystathionine beta-synthase
VLDHGKLVGIVDESDLLQGVIGHREAFAAPVMSVMTKDLEVAPSTATIASLLPLFDRGKVVIVKDGDSFLGLITKVDVLQYLRRGGA